jgi:hypothetical protein
MNGRRPYFLVITETVFPDKNEEVDSNGINTYFAIGHNVVTLNLHLLLYKAVLPRH